MSAIVDMVGDTFGRLTVVRRAASNHEGKAMWLLACICGGSTTARRSDLLSGRVVSCGCRKREPLTHGATAGGEPTPEYRTWQNMKKRCDTPHGHEVEAYAERGITVCARWRDSFDAFLEDMGPKPSPRHTIERIDNDRGYGPGNCKWATYAEQNANRRNCIPLIYRGERMVLSQALRLAGDPISRSCAKARLARGWSFEKAISEPKRPGHRIAA